ncbi:MAG: hypothetical protein ACM3ZS_02605 [Nitrososphaerota archaeon]
MYSFSRLAYTSVIFAIAVFALPSISILSVYAEPKVDISPTCGPHEPGFNIVMNVNGFMPNSTVAYKFVDSDSKIPLYGYFETNSTGGFNDVTFADDLKEGNYKLYFADDANNDNVFDIGAKRIYANVTIPCPN